MNNELTLDKIKKTVEYIQSLDRQVKEREDELAKRMGVDPEKDVLIVSASLFHGKVHLPHWIWPTKYLPKNEMFQLRQGVRDKRSKHG